MSSESKIQTQIPPKEKMSALIKMFRERKFKLILDNIEKLREQYPLSLQLKNLEGAVYGEQRQFKRASHIFREILQLNPSDPNAHNNLGHAQRSIGDSVSAIEHFTKAIELEPRFAEAYNNLGCALRERKDYNAAISSLKKAIEINPRYAEAYNNLGAAFGEINDTNASIECYQKALHINPDYGAPKHMLAALTGVQTSAAPREYVEALFDAYAENFEKSLVDDLEYKIPETLVKIMIENQSDSSLGAILDLGCGTGLVGDAAKEFSDKIIGLDLSNAMLEKADQKAIYDELVNIDIIDYLGSVDLDFDYFIASDVFIYIGSLTAPFELIKSRNKRNGKLAFSTEHIDEGDLFLAPSGRYSHSKPYIESLCKKFGYELTFFKETPLRKGKGDVIPGALYLLEF